MAKQWSEIRTENPAAPLTGAEITVAVQGGQSVGLTYQQLKDWVKFKNNLSATTSPAANDDSTAGYEAGSRWLNNTPTPKVWWICTDATAGAAVWDVLSLSEDELGSAALLNAGTGPGDVPLNSDLGSAAMASFSGMPFSNLIQASGRFANMADPFFLGLTEPFSSNSFFTPFNGCTVAEAGKFIHNNADFGGAGGSMTATMLDLIAAQGRAGTSAKNGVEYYVAEFTAGSGTSSSSQTGPDGTKYLTTITDQQNIVAADNTTTFTGWLRCSQGSIYLSEVSYSQIEVNGIDQSAAAPYVLSDSDGWVFVRLVSGASIGGYNNIWPRIMAANGDKFQVALPAAFAGAVNPGIYIGPQGSAGVLS